MLTSGTTVPAYFTLSSEVRHTRCKLRHIILKVRQKAKRKKKFTWLHTLSSLDRFTFLSLKVFQRRKLYTAERGRKIITNGGKEKVSNNATAAYSITFFSCFVRKEYDKARKIELGEPANRTEFRISYVLHVSVQR